MGHGDGDDLVYGKAFAAAYLTSLPVLLGGVGAALVTRGAVWPIAVAAMAALVLAALAHILADVDTDVGRYPLGWYRLVLGGEIPRAWRTLRR